MVLDRLLFVGIRDDKKGMRGHVVKLHRRLGLLIASGLVAVQIPLLAAFPAPSGYVNDFASALDESAETYLETFLETLERDTSAEIVLVTVTTLEGMTIEEYANRVFADWGIGKEQQDNGVLLLVAPSDRAVRIEVGYGLEPVLPDGLAGDIIRTEIIPEFRNGNYPRGIGRGLNRIAQVVRGDPAAASSVALTNARNDVPPIVIVAFFGAFIVFGAFVAGLGWRTKTFAPLVSGALFASTPLLMTVAISSLLPLVVLVPLGLAALAIGYGRGRSAYWMGMLRRGAPDPIRPDAPSEWIAGGVKGSSSDGSSGSSESSSSGGFGGGSSGGGGASGRW